MHTTSYDGDIHFLHNGDYSGEVEIVMPSDQADFELHHIDNTAHIKIPYKALEYLVAIKVSREFVSKLEDVDDMESLFKALLMVQKVPSELLQFALNIASLDEPENIDVRRVVRLRDIIDDAKRALGK